jgi:hypothetical protein
MGIGGYGWSAGGEMRGVFICSSAAPDGGAALEIYYANSLSLPLSPHTHTPALPHKMQLLALLALLAYASTASAAITWTLAKAASPTADQRDAYTRIEAAMRLAVARYSRFSRASKTIRVSYSPGVPTAEANYNGDLRFGSNRAYMSERTAMHEISHTLGVGQTAAFDRKCAAGDWRTALPLLRSWDGAAAKISCGGSHFWPYGLNYDNEWSETNADRHVKLVEAMLVDGM